MTQTPKSGPGPTSDPLTQAERMLAGGRPAEALAVLRSLERSDPRSLRAWARVLAALGRHDEAVPVLRRVLEMCPGDPMTAAELGHIERSLSAPPANSGERSWGTTIPREFLLTLQNALHRYSYAGIAMLKNPFDLAIYTRLLFDLRPGLILEIGSKTGASALWMAHQCDAFALDTDIISLDIVGVRDVEHPRVRFLEGDARDLEGVLGSIELAGRPRPWLVIDDADHAYETCTAVARWCAGRLRPGDYLIMEDGIISDLAPEAHPGYTSGPHRALRELLGEDPPRYEIASEYCDMFGTNVTWCTNGILRRIR